MGRINHLAVLVTVVLQQAIGFAWYHFGAIGGRWLAGIGRTPDQMRPTAAPFVVAIVASFLFSYAAAWLLRAARGNGWVEGLKVGFVLAFAVAGGAIAMHYAFLSAAGVLTPMAAIVDIGHDLVTGTITGIILGAWRKR